MGIKWIVFEILAIRALSDINCSASPRVLNPIKHSCSYIKQYLKHKYKYALSTNLPCASRHRQLLALLCIFSELISLQSSSAVSLSLCRCLRSFHLAKRSASSFSFRCLLDSIFVDLINAFYLIFRRINCC